MHAVRLFVFLVILTSSFKLLASNTGEFRCASLETMHAAVVTSVLAQSADGATAQRPDPSAMKKFFEASQLAVARTSLPQTTLRGVVFPEYAVNPVNESPGTDLADMVSRYTRESLVWARNQDSHQGRAPCLQHRIQVARSGVLGYLLFDDPALLNLATEALRAFDPAQSYAELNFWSGMARALAALHEMAGQSIEVPRTSADARLVSAVADIWSSVLLPLEPLSLAAEGDTSSGWCPNPLIDHARHFPSALPYVYRNLWTLLAQRSTLEKGLQLPDTLSVFVGLLLRRNHCVTVASASDSPEIIAVNTAYDRLKATRSKINAYPEERTALSLAVVSVEYDDAIASLTRLRVLNTSGDTNDEIAQYYAAHHRADAAALKKLQFARHDLTKTYAYADLVRVSHLLVDQFDEWASRGFSCGRESTVSEFAKTQVPTLLSHQHFNLQRRAPRDLNKAMSHLTIIISKNKGLGADAPGRQKELDASRDLAWRAINLYERLADLQDKLPPENGWGTSLRLDRLKHLSRTALASDLPFIPTVAYLSAGLDAGRLSRHELAKLDRPGDSTGAIDFAKLAVELNPLNGWYWQHLMSLLHDDRLSEQARMDLRIWTRAFMRDVNNMLLGSEATYPLEAPAREVLSSITDAFSHVVFNTSEFSAICAAVLGEQANRMERTLRCAKDVETTPIARAESLAKCKEPLDDQSYALRYYPASLFATWKQARFESPDLAALRAFFHARRQAQPKPLQP